MNEAEAVAGETKFKVLGTWQEIQDTSLRGVLRNIWSDLWQPPTVAASAAATADGQVAEGASRVSAHSNTSSTGRRAGENKHSTEIGRARMNCCQRARIRIVGTHHSCDRSK